MPLRPDECSESKVVKISLRVVSQLCRSSLLVSSPSLYLQQVVGQPVRCVVGLKKCQVVTLGASGGSERNPNKRLERTANQRAS